MDAAAPTFDAHRPPRPTGRRPWRLAVIGAGPAGLALALLAHRRLPDAEITLFDARALERDVSADPRTVALSLGSVQLLRRLGVWPAQAAQAITEVHVSQAPPTLMVPFGEAAVRLRAVDEGVPMLGAVLRYGQVVAPMQAAWQAAEAAMPHRLHTRFGTAVQALKPLTDPTGPGDGGVEVDAGIAEAFDLAVVAEGGVFAEQSRKAVAHDYRQTAWVGTATLQGAVPGMAFERFTRHGPAALLPLPPTDDGAQRAALVWCVPTDDDPVAVLDDAQRLAVLNTVFPPEAGRLVALSPLKSFALGLNAERTLVQRDARVVRIGNAAQTLHPVAGQGLNLGLRDAWSLVDALRDAWQPGAAGAADGAALDRALRRVEWARAPDRWSTIATTDFLARSFTWKAPGLAAARGLGLAALQALGPVKSRLARQMMYGRRG